MRYIPVKETNSRSWRNLSQSIYARLLACIDIQSKHDFLDKKENKQWNKLKPLYERLGHSKCWFTEANASVSDYSIEHFRPKKRVSLIKNFDNYLEARVASSNEGYWWLAYDIDNLRLASSKPNLLKGTYFPLATDSKIAQNQHISCTCETPILLDPCVKADTILIKYDGPIPVEANPNPTDYDHIRARISIYVYGLNRLSRLKTARAAEYWHATNYYKTALRNRDAMRLYDNTSNQAAYDLAVENFTDACFNLIMMLRPDKQFTKMIFDFLTGINQPWVDEFILKEARDRKFISW